MGDRGNIKIAGEYGEPIYFYTHWRASELIEIVAEGLDKGRERWGDEDYLNRIIFQTLLGGDESNLSFGIGTREAGDIWRMVEVNHKDKTVFVGERVYGEDLESWWKFADAVSFEDFIFENSITRNLVEKVAL